MVGTIIFIRDQVVAEVVAVVVVVVVVVRRIILHDNTLNLPVVARQPHPDPNYAPHTAARLIAVA